MYQTVWNMEPEFHWWTPSAGRIYHLFLCLTSYLRKNLSMRKPCRQLVHVYVRGHEFRSVLQALILCLIRLSGLLLCSLLDLPETGIAFNALEFSGTTSVLSCVFLSLSELLRKIPSDLQFSTGCFVSLFHDLVTSVSGRSSDKTPPVIS